jgi:hypothetical protein
LTVACGEVLAAELLKLQVTKNPPATRRGLWLFGYGRNARCFVIGRGGDLAC